MRWLIQARVVLAWFLAWGAASGCGPQKVAPGSPVRDAAAPADAAPEGPAAIPGLPTGPSGLSDGPSGRPVACPGFDTTEPASCAAVGVTLDPKFATRYTCLDLGPVPGVTTTKYGGLSLTSDACSETLIIGVDANAANAKLYSVGITRDASGRVNGFTGPASVLIDAPYHDGGVAYGPGGVLFITRWPVNEIQQTRPGSFGVDKVIPLDQFMVSRSASSLNFVPPNMPGGGSLKMVTFSTGDFYTLLLSPDGLGTYDIVGAKRERTLTGGPEGFVYVAAGSPLISAHSVLVSEWSGRRISLYEIDSNGTPRLDTNQTFISGLNGAEGAFRDPTTGDFFFSTWGHPAGDRVIVVRGFAPVVD